MKIGWIVIVNFLLLSFSTFADADKTMRLGLYVVVDDMQSAKQFYRELFGSDPNVDYGNFVSFRFDGGMFALYSKSAYTHHLNRGNNVVPYIQVTDIESEFARVTKLSPRMISEKIVDEGAIKLFMFTDPSGNQLEFFSLSN